MVRKYLNCANNVLLLATGHLATGAWLQSLNTINDGLILNIFFTEMLLRNHLKDCKRVDGR